MTDNPTGTMATRDVVAIARDLLAEAFEGAGPRGSWFVTARPDEGVFGTIRDLTAEEASRPARLGGPSVAAHVEHLRWWLALVNGTMHGEPWDPDWSASWSVSTVNGAAWRMLQADLRREFDAVMAVLASPPDELDPMMFRGVLAMAPHAAYHLGAIRQVVLKQAAE
jgi:hypothetical protein